MAHSTRPPNISLPARYIPEFNAFLVSIAEEITEEELEEMKFLCARQMNNNYLPRGKLDAIKNPHEFLSFLHQRDIICPEDVSYLVWLLKRVECTDLADSIEKQGKILVRTLLQIDLLRLNEAVCFPFINNAT